MENSSPTTPPTTNSLMKPASQEANCYPPIFSPIPTLGTTHLEVNSMTNQVTNQTIQVIRPPFYPHFSLPNTTNNLGNPAIQGTQTPFYGEYMHGYPPFVSCINTKPSWTTSQESVDAPCPTSRSPMICLTSTNVVEEVQDASRVEYSDPKSRTKSVESEDVEDSRTQSNLHSEVEGSIEEPKLGMVFTSDQDLFSYYKSYGKQCGFPVVTLRSRKTDDGKLKYVTIGCARAGKPRNRTSNVMRPCPTSKTDCKVKINATCIEGVWKVLTVDNTHNHDLSPKKSRFFSCNREVSESVKRQLDTNDQAGIRVNKSFTAIMQEAGGYEELSFTEKDCRNYIDKARQLRLGKGGAEALRGYFERMQEKNDGFFSCMDLDDDSRLRNIFWADARSRASYKYFGDVVTFDATYLTNRYEMPFTPFVGVNHHGQSILLGAGLLSSEDTVTYTWLFKTWLRCMGGIAPKAIVTDQDRTMKKAIADVFPNTRHRFCLWHILRKLPLKLGKKDTELNRDILKCIYDTQTIEEFEKCWENVISMYDVQDDPWLKAIYTERTFWVPVFLKDTFWAGMSTTQRSESMNAFFDGYVNPKTNLKEFVDQFDNALRQKIENETQADFQSFHAKIPLVSSLEIEEDFQRMYTNSRFREVQQQVLGMIGCLPVVENNDGVVVTYRVEDEVRVDNFRKEVTYFVDFHLDVQEARCSCGLFETRGILCRHQLVIFKIQRVRLVPEKYILDRWRKDLKRTYTLIPSTYDVITNRPEVLRYARMMKVFTEVATNVASCDEHTEDMIDKLYAMNEVYGATKPTQHAHDVTTADTTTGSSKVLSPLVKRGKGRPPSLRRKSLIEKVCKKTIRQANKKEKTKQSHGGEAQPVNTCRNLFSQNPLVGTQESMQIQIDGTQPDNRDVTQTDKATSTTKEVEVVEVAWLSRMQHLEQRLIILEPRVQGLLEVLPNLLTADILEQLRISKQSLVELGSRPGALRQMLLDLLEDPEEIRLMCIMGKNCTLKKGNDEVECSVLLEKQIAEEEEEEIEMLLENYLQRLFRCPFLEHVQEVLKNAIHGE